MKILNLSPYVKNQFEQNPYLYDLVANKFDLQSDWVDFQNKNPHLDIFALPRKYRQTRLALIAAQDSLTQKPQEHIYTLKQTSQLAKLLITYAYQQALNEMQQKCGDVLNANNDKQSLIIFALGKLGGNELNYSSDVDLVFCYTDNGQSNGKKSLDAQSYFNRLGRRIIQILDSITTNGIVFRVDMRLRPFGSAAPLTCSAHNLLTYLESEGRDWERYAWLRASFISGDKQAAYDALNHIQPFIYRKYLDYSIFESLRQIKAQIERKQLDDENNLKLGIGGIREIEFIVQTLQITFGGRNKLLRGNDLWQQMHRLCEFKHISVQDLQQLTAAWLFLRKLENLCQIIHDRDSHHLPEETEALAVCMGLKNSEELTQQLQTHRDKVHTIFQQLFISNKVENKNEIFHPQIQQIKDEISARNYPKTIKHKIYSALDAITGLLPDFENQDEVIRRYKQVINAVSKRQSYLSMLVESPLVLQKLITQISHSAYFSSCIAKTPSLLEVLFDGFDEDDFEIEKQWQIFSKMHDADDTEEQLELLAQFKQRIQFKAIMAYIDGLHNTLQTCEILTLLAEFILSQVIKLSWQEIQQKIPNSIQADDLIVIAYGSLAMKTMHLNSDFDLVFVLASDINDNNHKFVMRWIKCIINYLSIQSYSGKLYQLDTQLRPNGQSGAAIVSRSNFENYQKNEAWTWEHAALIKTRAVYATESQKNWFKTLRCEVLTQKRQAQKVNDELNEMAIKMKQLDKNHHNEFIELGEILTKANSNPELIYSLKRDWQKITQKLDQSIIQ
jgi:glutamate-ammonia-ligase adenylyltransferase